MVMGRYGRLRRIRQMDPRQDYEQIFWWLTQYEFPWDYLQGVSVAFLRDYGVPRISRLLDRTQEFERAGQKRYDDTVLIAYELVRDGMDSDGAVEFFEYNVMAACFGGGSPLFVHWLGRTSD